MTDELSLEEVIALGCKVRPWSKNKDEEDEDGYVGCYKGVHISVSRHRLFIGEDSFVSYNLKIEYKGTTIGEFFYQAFDHSSARNRDDVMKFYKFAKSQNEQEYIARVCDRNREKRFEGTVNYVRGLLK